MIYFDFFFLLTGRDQSKLAGLVKAVLERPEPMAVEYEFPQYEPTTVFKTADQLMAHLETSLHADYSLYWRDAARKSYNASLHYFEDGGVAIGVSIPGVTTPSVELKRLGALVGSDIGYGGIEENPPGSSEALAERARGGPGARLFKGKVLK